MPTNSLSRWNAAVLEFSSVQLLRLHLLGSGNLGTGQRCLAGPDPAVDPSGCELPPRSVNCCRIQTPCEAMLGTRICGFDIAHGASGVVSG
jgi:hypothetical protein